MVLKIFHIYVLERFSRFTVFIQSVVSLEKTVLLTKFDLMPPDAIMQVFCDL